MGVAQGQIELQPLLTRCQTQPVDVGTPTQSQPLLQSTPEGVVVVAQSQVVVDVLLDVLQSGG